MTHQLRAGISTGRIDSDLGSFEIRDGQVEVDDYDTAAALVERYSVVEWPDGDPGAPDDAGDEEPESEDDSEFDAEAFAGRTPMSKVVDDLETGEYDDHLDAIEAAADRVGVQDAIDERREEPEE